MATLSNGGQPIDAGSVLELTQRLAESLDAIDLDVIDGEFYWRFCRQDLFPAIERLVGDAKALISRFDGAAGREGVLEWRAAWDEVWLGFTGRFAGELPNVVDYIFDGGWLRLRDAHFVWSHEYTTDLFGRFPMEKDVESRATIRVFTRGWSGAEVERRLRAWMTRDHPDPRQRAPWERWREGARTAPWPDHAAAVSATFRLVRDEAAEPWLPGGRPPFAAPHVVVTTALPLPPDGVIARLYDAIVREQHSWHEQLLGAANADDARRALRTWALALSMKAGLTYLDAARRVGALLNPDDPDEVSYPQFQEDRAALIERLPKDAEPYLRVRPARGGK